MGSVDLANQLHNHYCIDMSWHRNRKWGWGFQVILTNSYISYLKFHKMLRTKPRYTHYNYIKSIALAWMNKDQFWPKHQSAEPRKKKGDDDGVRRTRASKKLNMIMSDSSTQLTCTPVNDKTLDPMNGKLKCRLNNSYQHLPERPSGKRSRCALHQWARNRGGK